MKLPIYQVDAFADKPFTGNPAAICPLESWLEDQQMQAIAEENNLSETAFIVPTQEGYYIRWFTPTCEVDLCGHATLAAAHVAINHLNDHRNPITFDSKSGTLLVNHHQNILTLDFPALTREEIKTPPALINGLGKTPTHTFAADDYLAVFESEDDITGLSPDFSILGQLDRRGIIATAPGKNVDFVSRFFAPNAGINEDPVTGSAHCLLTPYWANRLNLTQLTAKQLSKRGGTLVCELKNDRVLLSGRAIDYLKGEIFLIN